MPREKASKREKITYAAVVLAAIAAAVPAGIAIVGLLSSGEKSPAAAPRGSVRITAAYVRNEAEEAYLPEAGIRGIQTLASTPTMDFEVHNPSPHTAYVREVKITIVGYAHIEVCFAQGGSARTIEPPPNVIVLPQYPVAGEKHASSHLHYEVPPEGNQDIPVRISTGRVHGGEYSLYKVRASLALLGIRKPVDAGTFVLSAPDRIPVDDSYFPVDNSYFKQFVSRGGSFRRFWLQVYWCMRRNTTLVEGLLRDGVIAPQLAVLKHPVYASEWGRVRNRVPLREAAERLLAEQDPELGMFVASATRNKRFERRVRPRAAAELLRGAAKTLEPNGDLPFGEQEARKAVTIESSGRGISLLAQLERRVQATAAEREVE